jgi:hypothetical protein
MSCMFECPKDEADADATIAILVDSGESGGVLTIHVVKMCSGPSGIARELEPLFLNKSNQIADLSLSEIV